MFNQLKLKIGNYLLRKDLSKKKRLRTLVSLSNAKKIGLLFDAEDLKSIQKIKSFLKYFLALNIDVDVLGFINSRKKENVHIATLHINYFNLNDVNMFGVPSSKKAISFMRKNHDMLINLSLCNSFETKYLALLSNARYKIGVFDVDVELSYDLMLKLKIKSLDYFIENLIHYLELINSNEKQ